MRRLLTFKFNVTLMGNIILFILVQFINIKSFFIVGNKKIQQYIEFDPNPLTVICICMCLYNLLIHMSYTYILLITDSSLSKGGLRSIRKKVA